MKSTKQFVNCNNCRNKLLFYSENNNLIEVIEINYFLTQKILILIYSN